MFSRLFKKQDDGINYSELVPYFKKNELDVFVNNEEFKYKYKRHTNTINSFIHEIRKDIKGIKTIEIIQKYIIDLDEDEMMKVVTLLLSKPEMDKNEFFRLVDKKYGYDKTEEDIKKEQDLLNEFNRVKHNDETFNNISLNDLFDTLDINEKEYLIEVIRTPGALDIIKELFEERYRIGFKYVIRLLSTRGIDVVVLNYELFDFLGYDNYRELVFTLLSNVNEEITKYTKVLINNKRYDLIKDMIEMNLISDVIMINSNKEEINDYEIIDSIEKLKIKMLVNAN